MNEPGLPIEDCPVNDGWILAYDPTLTEAFTTRPWVIATRSDDGWYSSEGDSVEPTRYVSLPDPQPPGTGWAPAVGTIEIDTCTGVFTIDGKPVEMRPPVNWVVSVILPNGSADPTREPYCATTLPEARGYAERWGRKLGLPVHEVATTAPYALSGVPDMIPGMDERSAWGMGGSAND